MRDLKDDEQLELGFERGKRVEFTYDEPETQEEKEPEMKAERSEDTESHRRKGRKATVIVLIAAAFCAVLAGTFFWFYGKRVGGQETQDETQAADETHSADDVQYAMTLSEDYAAHMKQLKSYLSREYSNASMMELVENGEYSLQYQKIFLADLDGDGAKPEAVFLTEYVTSMENLVSSTLPDSKLMVVYFDLADQLQTCSIEVSQMGAPTQCLMLNMKEDHTAQIILYKQEIWGGADYSLLYEYNSDGTGSLRKCGEVPGRIASRLIWKENIEEYSICYDMDGIYQVREGISGNNGYEDYAYERVYSYALDEEFNTLVLVGLNGMNVSWEGEGLNYYSLEDAPWWNMRRPLLALMPANYMDEQYLLARQPEALYGTAAHLIGGFSGTDLYLIETDYGDRGVILLSDPNNLDACMVDMQGLPFFEVFALEEQETLSEELYAYLDMHITAPGYYKIDEPCYVWIDLNGDGMERRFLVNEHIDIGDQESYKTLIPFYMEHAEETVRYLTVTDLDPADHRMEIGISAFCTVSEGDGASEQVFTCLYQSLDGVHLVRISEPTASYLYAGASVYYFAPFDPVSGEPTYAEGKVWLEFSSSPDYIVQAVYDGCNLRITDDTLAVLRAPVQTAVASLGLSVYKEASPYTGEAVELPKGTAVTVDGFMLKAYTEVSVFSSMDAFLYRVHLSTEQGAYYTDYMPLWVVRETLGLSDFVGVPYQE